MNTILALPAIVYDLYYAKVLGEPLWSYRIRALPGSELLAAPSLKLIWAAISRPGGVGIRHFVALP